MQLAKELSRAVQREQIDAYAQEVSDYYKERSWDLSYQKVEEIIKREVCDV